MNPIPSSYQGRTGWLLLFTVAYCIAAYTALKTYIQPFSANCLLGIAALLLTITKHQPPRLSYRFAVVSIVFAALYLFIPSKTILFASIAIAVFYVSESFIGRLNYLAVSCVLLISPIAEYLANLFSFPIRLFLTSIAGKMLKRFNGNVVVEGNNIAFAGTEFSVDPACMGRHMFVISLIAGVILTAVLQQKYQRTLPLHLFLASSLLIVLFNIISNLFRILILVKFNISPGMPMHEVTGLICFFVYILIPAYLTLRYLIRKRGRSATFVETSAARSSWIPVVINSTLLVIICVVIYTQKNKSIADIVSVNSLVVPGYTSTNLDEKITKLENRSSFVYIKPIAGFYSSDHQPMICWSGSGYEFKKVRQKNIGSAMVYDAVLDKGNDVLYTAWWYDNGSSTTISQFEWRWDSFYNSKAYALVNVTASSPKDLEIEIQKLMSLKPLKGMFAAN